MAGAAPATSTADATASIDRRNFWPGRAPRPLRPRIPFTTLCAKHLVKTETVVRCPKPLTRAKVGAEAEPGHLIEKDEKEGRLVRGYALGKDRYLSLSEADLAEVEPEPEPQITVEAVLELAGIDPVHFAGGVQILAADVGSGPVVDALAARSYAALVEALVEESQGEGLVAIGRWPRAGHDKLVGIVAKDRRLLALDLRRAGEVRDLSDIPAAEAADPALIDRLGPVLKRLKVDHFAANDYPDIRYDLTLDLLQEKAREREKAPPKRRQA